MVNSFRVWDPGLYNVVQGSLGTKPAANAEVFSAGRRTSVRSAAPAGMLNIVPFLLFSLEPVNMCSKADLKLQMELRLLIS